MVTDRPTAHHRILSLSSSLWSSHSVTSFVPNCLFVCLSVIYWPFYGQNVGHLLRLSLPPPSWPYFRSKYARNSLISLQLCRATILLINLCSSNNSLRTPRWTLNTWERSRSWKPERHNSWILRGRGRGAFREFGEHGEESKNKKCIGKLGQRTFWGTAQDQFGKSLSSTSQHLSSNPHHSQSAELPALGDHRAGPAHPQSVMGHWPAWSAEAQRRHCFPKNDLINRLFWSLDCSHKIDTAQIRHFLAGKRLVEPQGQSGNVVAGREMAMVEGKCPGEGREANPLLPIGTSLQLLLGQCPKLFHRERELIHLVRHFESSELIKKWWTRVDACEAFVFIPPNSKFFHNSKFEEWRGDSTNRLPISNN